MPPAAEPAAVVAALAAAGATVATAESLTAGLLAATLADWIRRLREAALKDEEGRALDGALLTIRSFA